MRAVFFPPVRVDSALRNGLSIKLSVRLGVTHCHLIARLKGSQSRCSLLHVTESHLFLFQESGEQVANQPCGFPRHTKGYLLSLSIDHQGLRSGFYRDHLTSDRLRRSKG